jgi:hypothetical protein
MACPRKGFKQLFNGVRVRRGTKRAADCRSRGKHGGIRAALPPTLSSPLYQPDKNRMGAGLQVG